MLSFVRGARAFSLCSLNKHRMPHGRHIKEERKEIIIGNFSLDGSSHQTGDAAFTPATPHDLHHSRANNDSHNSHNTQHTRVKQNTLCFKQKDTQPSQKCSGGHITPNPTHNRTNCLHEPACVSLADGLVYHCQ